MCCLAYAAANMLCTWLRHRGSAVLNLRVDENGAIHAPEAQVLPGKAIAARVIDVPCAI